MTGSLPSSSHYNYPYYWIEITKKKDDVADAYEKVANGKVRFRAVINA